MQVTFEVKDVYTTKQHGCVKMWEPTGEFRHPEYGDNWVSLETKIVYKGPYDCNEVIVKQIRWRAEYGSMFWYVNTISMKVCCEQEVSTVDDDARFNAGNYYQTKEEAEKMLNSLESLFSDSTNL